MNKNNNASALIERYEGLSKLSKETLEIISLIYAPASNTRILIVAQTIGLIDSTGWPVSVPKFSMVIRELFSSKLIVGSNLDIKCNHLIIEQISRLAYKRKKINKTIRNIRNIFPAERYSSKPESFEICIREVRFGIYYSDALLIKKYISKAQKYFSSKYKEFNVVEEILNNPFDVKFIKTLTYNIQEWILSEIVNSVINNLAPVDVFLEFLLEYKNNSVEEYGEKFRELILLIDIHKGEFDKAREIIDLQSQVSQNENNACIDFLLGNNNLSINNFDKALKEYKKSYISNTTYFYNASGLFYIIAMIKDGYLANLKKIEKSFNLARNDIKRHNVAYNIILSMEYYLLNRRSDAMIILNQTIPDDCYSKLLYYHALYWFDSKGQKDKLKEIVDFYNKAKKNGYIWIAFEIACLLKEITNKDQYKNYIAEIQKTTNFCGLIDIIKKQSEWERSLEALSLLSLGSLATKSKAEERLIWLVNFETKHLEPKEQKITAKGLWTKGRAVALKRIKNGGVKSMTAQDHKIGSCIKMQKYGYYTSEDYFFENDDKVFLNLVGHPLLFLYESPTTQCELIKAEPELLIEKNGKNFEIKFSIDIDYEEVVIHKESPTKYKLYSITEQHKEIANIIGYNNLKVPASAKDALIKAISNISNIVTVHSAIDGGDGKIPTVKADERIYVHLLPSGSGFKLELFVKPFGDEPPYFKPGIGGTNIIAMVNNERVQAQRKLKSEIRTANTLMLACPSLAEMEDHADICEFADPEACLEVLTDLEKVKDQIVVEWPEGQKISVSHNASFDKFSMRIQKKNNWFDVSGELKIDDDLVLSMQQLLQLVEQSRSRFIKIDENRFVALTQEFRRKLLEVNTFAEKTKKDIRFHPLAALTLEGLTENLAEFEADDHWKKHTKQLQNARKYNPRLPSTLHADLRDYQIDGYRWLARLANWGVGACLADDMGLGKTLQGIALMLQRIKKGPSLVVAPASVAINWISEIKKFAPTLKPHLLYDSKDRKATIKSLKEFDVLVSSYGLLQSESKLFAEKKWNNVILDEAQAIKNTATKRSKAAMELQADFRMVMTGTPLENNLGELWNLFNFINPGLLGSLKSFNERFATAIVKDEDKQSKKQLKKLIQPFILRRLKDQVLDELPAKTEITLTVSLSKEENSFYEALRKEAVNKLENMEKPKGQKHLQILAEIMKLRRACCHPQLVVPDTPLTSSKLELFSETVDNLIENKHKILVFSQFVGHLAILRKHLETKKIAYQYLDGSTSIKQRQINVNAFQHGDGEVFLISLKAGGTGLNLTAADYVIHMDPWWNPAVEDQASDRAHRIGQDRPVTIYRLVAKNTIEEKIVNLHKQKRALADSLLDGSDVSGRVSADDLLKLIKEN